MPKKTVAGHKEAHAAAATKENAAKAAFEEYRKRMETSKAPGGANKEPKLNIGHSPGHPYMPPPPQQMFFGGAPGMPQQPLFYGQNQPGLPSPFKQAEGSLFGSIGNMVKLMVGVMNAGLAGGLQLMGGFAHGGGGHCAPQGHHDGCRPPQSDCCSSGYTDSCCEPCCDCRCRPSVNNCDCC